MLHRETRSNRADDRDLTAWSRGETIVPAEMTPDSAATNERRFPVDGWGTTYAHVVIVITEMTDLTGLDEDDESRWDFKVMYQAKVQLE